MEGWQYAWQKLSDLKDSHPLQVAEFALATGIVNQSAFNWLVKWILKKRDPTRYHKWIHKFGIELPKNVDEAYVIDKARGTSFWHDVIELEIKNVQFMKCHMIFEIKMEDFCHKAWLVARGHMRKATTTLTYASIVS
ncbi:hypothetical protein ACHAW6_000059 [Cyclotella cf. meneghiniana]